MPYLCPLCEHPSDLQSSSTGYTCTNKHHFDLAKEGYLNLLPAHQKNSKSPGDSKEMIQARRSFLEAGYYHPLAESLIMLMAPHWPRTILDIGCGEGFYDRYIEQHISNSQNLDLHGVDIAKAAIRAAAKKQPCARFAVASSQRLPYHSDYFDLLLRIYAPSSDAELFRVLRPGGLLLTVTPGPRHLWQIKEYIYPLVREHPTELSIPPGFEVINTQRVSYKITPSQEHRMALLQMTPFAWRANVAVRQAIQAADAPSIETDFVLTLSTKERI